MTDTTPRRVKKFIVKICIPPDYKRNIPLIIPISHTIEDVKNEAFREILDLKGLEPNEYLLGISPEDQSVAQKVRQEITNQNSATHRREQGLILYLIRKREPDPPTPQPTPPSVVRKPLPKVGSLTSAQLSPFKVDINKPAESQGKNQPDSAQEVTMRVRRESVILDDNVTLNDIVTFTIGNEQSVQSDKQIPDLESAFSPMNSPRGHEPLESSTPDSTPDSTTDSTPSDPEPTSPKTPSSSATRRRSGYPLRQPLEKVNGLAGIVALASCVSNEEFPVQLSLDSGFSIIVPCKNQTNQEFIDDLLGQLQQMATLLMGGDLADINEGNQILSKEFVLQPKQPNLTPDPDIPENTLPIKHLRIMRPGASQMIHSASGPLPFSSASQSAQDTNRRNRIALGAQRNDSSPSIVRRNAARDGKKIDVEIGLLIGRPLCWTSKNPEALHYRTNIIRKYANVPPRKLTQISRAEITKSNLPSPLHRKFTTNFCFHDSSNITSVQCEAFRLFSDAIREVIAKPETELVTESDGMVFNGFVAKLRGSTDILYGTDTLLTSFVTIRDILKRNCEPHIILIPAKKLEEDLYMLSNRDKVNIDLPIAIPSKEIPTPSPVLGVHSIAQPFEFRLIAMESLQDIDQVQNTEKKVYVECRLYHGLTLIADPIRTTSVPLSSPLFIQNISFNILTRNLPKATRACFIVYFDTRSNNGGEDEILGWSTLQLASYNNQLVSGPQHLGLWIGTQVNVANACVSNTSSPYSLIVEFNRYPAVARFLEFESDQETPRESKSLLMTPECSQLLNQVLESDPLYNMSEEEKHLIWKYRSLIMKEPKSLIKLLKATSWHDPMAVKEIHQIIETWAPLSPLDAFELLGASFADEKVREFAVKSLDPLDDKQLCLLMLQFTQMLKYESYHDSCLSRFLLQRALIDREDIGHVFFWHIRKELTNSECLERFSLFAEAYLRGCGDHRSELVKQVNMVNKLKSIAVEVQRNPISKRNEILRAEIEARNLPVSFHLPSNPTVKVDTLQLDQCKSKDSFTAPLWLVWKVKDWVNHPLSIPVMFKVGDDLRQDSLTLQAIRIMDSLWRKEGLDFGMSPYEVLPTGEMMGFIEVVQNAASIADIQKGAGGVAAAAFTKTPLQRWLRQHNPSEEQYSSAVRNFTYSCVGYCVASYILGLGDRHNDNIMVTSSGQLFHIDFAHFMGNMMKWKGIKRETAPFVLTPEIAYVMGGEKGHAFRKFVSLSCKAFNILRKHSHLFINLFALMVHAKIPQLNFYSDLEHLRKAFMCEKTDEEARDAFMKLITKCLSSLATRANFVIHLLAHPDKD